MSIELMIHTNGNDTVDCYALDVGDYICADGGGVAGGFLNLQD